MHEDIDKSKIDRSKSEETQDKILKNLSIERFGSILGEAFYNYAFGPRLQETKAHDVKDHPAPGTRRAFAEALTQALETGNYEEKVKAIASLLESIEEIAAHTAQNAVEEAKKQHLIFTR